MEEYILYLVILTALLSPITADPPGNSTKTPNTEDFSGTTQQMENSSSTHPKSCQSHKKTEKCGCSVEEEYKKGYVTPEKVAALRDWVSTQPYLPGKYITDLDLAFAFNRSSGCLNDAKEKLDHYLTVKTLFMELFQDRVQSDWWLNNTLNFAPLFELPTRSKKGYKTDYLTFGNPEDYDVTDICKFSLMLAELGQHLNCTNPGLILIVDMQNFTELHIDKIYPLSIFQQYFYYLESAWLGYFNELHYINLSEATCDLQKVLLESMSKTLAKKTFFHKNLKSLDKYFPIKGLPEEAGGKSKCIKEFQDSTMEEFKTNEDYFIADRKKRVDERKRPGGPKNITQIMDIIQKSLPSYSKTCEFC